MIIPIRSESDVKKLPYFTMSLIALNAVIWIFTNQAVKTDETAMVMIRGEMAKIEIKYAERISEDAERMEQVAGSPEAYFQHIMNTDDFALWNALYEQFKQSSIFYRWGFRPKALNPFRILVSMFIHGGFWHLFGNMIFLWVVGCNIEDEWGWKLFVGFYLISGFAAAGLHTLMNPGSDTPCVGASGAIAGVMGAFMIRHFKTKIRFAYYFLPFKPFFGTFAMAAGIWLPIWFGEQFWGAKLLEAQGISGIAYWAHIGGFAFGAVVGLSSKAFDAMSIPIVSAGTGHPKPKPTPEKLLELHKALIDGNTSAVLEYVPQIRQILQEDPANVTAWLILAKLNFEKGHLRDSAALYNRALSVLFRQNNTNALISLVREIREMDMFQAMPENSLLKLAMVHEKRAEWLDAVELYNRCIVQYPNSPLRPKVLHRAALILKSRLNNETAAERALAHLKKEYPTYANAHLTHSTIA